MADRPRNQPTPKLMSTVTDPIADLLARVRNAGASQKPEMFVPYSKIKSDVARILKDEG